MLEGNKIKFNTIDSAIEDIRKGKFVVVVDDEKRENEGDLTIAAEKVTPEAINFMIKKGGGLVCMPIIKERLKELKIDLMVKHSTEKMKTAFTVSIDAADCTTGISAYERARTVHKVLDKKAKPKDFTRPGHIFPLVAQKGGVLKRAGHTEAIVDLARLAGLYPAGVICEIIKEDGNMARLPDLLKFCKNYRLKIISIADLIKYRKKKERSAKKVTISKLTAKYGIS